MLEKSDFEKTFDLHELLSFKPKRNPQAHQNEALISLNKWYHTNEKRKGALLVIPTGGGKTFTAARFICGEPLSEGCKVLWLAHTHHLLEQAYYTFAPQSKEEIKQFGFEISNVQNDSGKIKLRVVSGEQNHFKVSDIEKDDDIIFCTLQSAVRAFNRHHPRFTEFINNATKLIVVFDEAHHSPANTYGQFMVELYNNKKENLHLLGLTATPTHGNELKKTYFKKLFPQGKLPEREITVSRLQADRILSKLEILQPVKITDKTFKPSFNQGDFKTWVRQFHNDIPETVITAMADSEKRNSIIASTYDKKIHGKTIIFADRWYQCEVIVELLKKRNISAGALYSYNSNQRGTADQRNVRRRDKTDQAKDLAEFKNPDGKLDVLVNINILTEGTDVPSVETVFITRQTTSEIRLRQMVGRALRGPVFGGTESSKVVLFEDHWQMDDILGEFAELPEDLLPLNFEKKQTHYKYTYQLVSIDLVKKLARAMNEGTFSESLTFDKLFPIGWYETKYSLSSESSDEITSINKLSLVFSHEKEEYAKMIIDMKLKIDPRFKDSNMTFEKLGDNVNNLKAEYFKQEKSISSPLEQNIFNIGKHLASEANEGEIKFFTFENRNEHNVELLANQFIESKWDSVRIRKELIFEYQRSDRYWKTLYQSNELFINHFESAKNRILALSDPYIELSENAIKRGVKKNDNLDDNTIRTVKLRDKVCQCCGQEHGRLDVDHIKEKYIDKDHSLENLQLLCKPCHNIKTKMETNKITLNFRESKPIGGIELNLDLFKKPYKTNDVEEWSVFMKRVINFLYGCKAVIDLKIGSRNDSFYNWNVTLNPIITKVPDQIFQRNLLKFINNEKMIPINSIKFNKL